MLTTHHNFSLPIHPSLSHHSYHYFILHSDRDTMAQVRVPISSLLSLLQQLVRETLSWSEVMARHVVVNAGGAGADDADEEGGAAAGKTETAASSVAVTAAAAPVVVEYSTRGSFSRPNPLVATATTAK